MQSVYSNNLPKEHLRILTAQISMTSATKMTKYKTVKNTEHMYLQKPEAN